MESLKETYCLVTKFTIFTETYPGNMFTSLVCVKFANETRCYTNHICTVDSRQSSFYFFIRKHMSEEITSELALNVINAEDPND